MKHIGNLEITKDNERGFKNLKEVTGYLYVDRSAKLDAPLLTTVGGDLYVDGSAKLDAPLLTTVGGDLYVDGSAKLDALTTVGGYLYVDGSAKLDALTTVGSYLRVYGSEKLDAPLLTTVGGDLRVDRSAKLDAPLLTTVGGDLYVDGSAKLDAPLLTTVGGYLRVDGSAKLDALTTVGGYLRVYGSAKLDAPNIKNKSDDKAKAIATKALAAAFKKRKLVKVDGILSFLISVKTIKSLKLFKVKIVGKLEVSFIIQKGEVFSHGKTIKEAKDSIKYKLSDRDTTRFKKWKLTDSKNLTSLINAYRAITGACELGTRHFCESSKLKPKYTVKEVIELTKGKYGNEQFKAFFEV